MIRKAATLDSARGVDGSLSLQREAVLFSVECDGCWTSCSSAPDLMSAAMGAETALWFMTLDAKKHFCQVCVGDAVVSFSAATVYAEHTYMDENGNPALDGILVNRDVKLPDPNELKELFEDARKVIFGDEE